VHTVLGVELQHLTDLLRQTHPTQQISNTLRDEQRRVQVGVRRAGHGATSTATETSVRAPAMDSTRISRREVSVLTATPRQTRAPSGVALTSPTRLAPFTLTVGAARAGSKVTATIHFPAPSSTSNASHSPSAMSATTSS